MQARRCLFWRYFVQADLAFPGELLTALLTHCVARLHPQHLHKKPLCLQNQSASDRGRIKQSAEKPSLGLRYEYTRIITICDDAA